MSTSQPTPPPNLFRFPHESNKQFEDRIKKYNMILEHFGGDVDLAVAQSMVYSNIINMKCRYPEKVEAALSFIPEIQKVINDSRDDSAERVDRVLSNVKTDYSKKLQHSGLVYTRAPAGQKYQKSRSSRATIKHSRPSSQPRTVQHKPHRTIATSSHRTIRNTKKIIKSSQSSSIHDVFISSSPSTISSPLAEISIHTTPQRFFQESPQQSKFAYFHVSGLPPRMQWFEIRDHFRGEGHNVLNFDTTQNGCGTGRFSTFTERDAFIQQYNNKKWLSDIIRVTPGRNPPADMFENRQPCWLNIRGLPSGYRWAHLKDTLRTYAPIWNVTPHETNAHVKFYTTKDRDYVLQCILQNNPFRISGVECTLEPELYTPKVRPVPSGARFLNKDEQRMATQSHDHAVTQSQQQQYQQQQQQQQYNHNQPQRGQNFNSNDDAYNYPYQPY